MIVITSLSDVRLERKATSWPSPTCICSVAPLHILNSCKALKKGSLTVDLTSHFSLFWLTLPLKQLLVMLKEQPSSWDVRHRIGFHALRGYTCASAFVDQPIGTPFF